MEKRFVEGVNGGFGSAGWSRATAINTWAAALDRTYNYMFTQIVPFEWDPSKAAANYRKRGVRFSDALGVFSDDLAIKIRDGESDPEEQPFVTLGIAVKGRVLTVVYACWGESVRIIQARKAGRAERELYEEPR